LGTDGNDYFQLIFWASSGTTGASRNNSLALQNIIVDIARVSVVEGDATLEDDPFEARHISQEKSLCQRYYEKHVGNFVVVDNIVSSYPSITFLVPKRSIPTVTATYNAGTGASYGVSKQGLYQSNNHSVDSVAYLDIDAEL
jgi:hypothetical protein